MLLIHNQNRYFAAWSVRAYSMSTFSYRRCEQGDSNATILLADFSQPIKGPCKAGRNEYKWSLDIDPSYNVVNLFCRAKACVKLNDSASLIRLTTWRSRKRVECRWGCERWTSPFYRSRSRISSRIHVLVFCLRS